MSIKHGHFKIVKEDIQTENTHFPPQVLVDRWAYILKHLTDLSCLTNSFRLFILLWIICTLNNKWLIFLLPSNHTLMKVHKEMRNLGLHLNSAQ